MNTHPLGEVLVPVDGFGPSTNAAWRAALVARDLGAPLRLLHVQEGVRAGAASEAALRRLALEIGERTGVTPQLDTVPGKVLEETVRAARDAALLVIGPRPGNPLRAMVVGTQAEQLIRLCRVPVLVVKKPATAGYRRVLVPVELVPAARPMIAAAARLARDGLEVLHALQPGDEIGMRACEVPEWVVRRQRQRAADEARAALHGLIAQAVQPRGVRTMVGFGDAARLALAREAAMRADLLVIGKRTRGLLADFFLGSVTQRLLASARADVLVLPRPTRAGAVEAPPAWMSPAPG